MDDLISRQEAIEALAKHEKSRGHNYTLFVDIVSECAEIIRDLPSAEPVRMKGNWVRKLDGVYCSVCYQGWDFITGVPIEVEGYNFCPNCGACMSEGGAND